MKYILNFKYAALLVILVSVLVTTLPTKKESSTDFNTLSKMYFTDGYTLSVSHSVYDRVITTSTYTINTVSDASITYQNPAMTYTQLTNVSYDGVVDATGSVYKLAKYYYSDVNRYVRWLKDLFQKLESKGYDVNDLMMSVYYITGEDANLQLATLEEKHSTRCVVTIEKMKDDTLDINVKMISAQNDYYEDYNFCISK